MMKGMTLALLAVLLAVGSAQIRFDLNSASYEIAGGYWSLNVPVTGAVLPAEYSYFTLPAGWIQVGNSLRIPSALAGGTFQVIVSVTDASGNTYRRRLLIRIDGASIFLGDFDPNQILSFSDSGAVTTSASSSAVLNSASSSSVISTQSGATSLGSNANSFGNPSSTAGVITLESSNPGINKPLPTAAQLDALINSGDIVSITQTIQSVIASTLTCTQKTGYLNDFLARIESFIVIKERQAGSIQGIIDLDNNQVANLQAQITTLEASIADLGIPGLQERLANLLVRLQQAYDAYNAANIDLTPFNLNISANLQTIQRLSTLLKETEAQLGRDEISLADVIALIATLEEQLRKAISDRDGLQARILAQQARIAATQAQIDVVNAENVGLNNQIALISQEKDTLLVNAQSLEAQAQNLKNTIASYEAQQSQYNSRIVVFRTQIRDIQNNADDSSLRTVLQHVDSLRGRIPSLREQIDYVRFNCNGVVNYTVSTLDGTIRYTFGRSSFSTFVTNEFGEANSNAASAFLGPISNVTLTPVTILDARWVELFGQAFRTDLQAISNGIQTNTFRFLSDFSCSGEGPVSSGAGTVVLIEPNLVRVRLSNNEEVDLLLAACTNILLLNTDAARIGGIAYWRGVENSDGSVQAYSVLVSA